MEYTFDNPNNYMARWGKVCRNDGSRVCLVFIGWGYLWEIRGERKDDLNGLLECPTCGDYHEKDTVPLTCATGDGS